VAGCDAQIVKRVSKDCADASFHEAVEAADGSHGCFAGCNGGAETPCYLRFSHLKTINLPKQARDKHRKS